MTDSEFQRKQEELDRLLNDPETDLHPDRIWSLMEDIARASPAPEWIAG